MPLPEVLLGCHRKGYHLLALGLFLPALLWEPQLLSISLAIAFALLVVLEIMRLGGVPYVGKLTTTSHAVLLLLPPWCFCGAVLLLQFLLLPGAFWHLINALYALRCTGLGPVLLLLDSVNGVRSGAKSVPCLCGVLCCVGVYDGRCTTIAAVCCLLSDYWPLSLDVDIRNPSHNVITPHRKASLCQSLLECLVTSSKHLHAPTMDTQNRSSCKNLSVTSPQDLVNLLTMSGHVMQATVQLGAYNGSASWRSELG